MTALERLNETRVSIKPLGAPEALAPFVPGAGERKFARATTFFLRDGNRTFALKVPVSGPIKRAE